MAISLVHQPTSGGIGGLHRQMLLHWPTGRRCLVALVVVVQRGGDDLGLLAPLVEERLRALSYQAVSRATMAVWMECVASTR